MAINKPILMATDIRGQITYAVNPPTLPYVWQGVLTAGVHQSVTLPLTQDVNVPWQVFLKVNNPVVGTSDTWVSYTPNGAAPVAAALPTATLTTGTSTLEPAGWVVEGGATLDFISSLTGDQVSLIAYLGNRGNY